MHDRIAAEIGDGTMKIHVRRDGILIGLCDNKPLMNLAQVPPIPGLHLNGSQARKRRLQNKPRLRQLPESRHLIRQEQRDSFVQGSVQTIDHLDPGPVTNLQHALLFQSFGCLSNHGPAHPQLLSQRTFRRQPAITCGHFSADVGGQLKADLLDEIINGANRSQFHLDIGKRSYHF